MIMSQAYKEKHQKVRMALQAAVDTVYEGLDFKVIETPFKHGIRLSIFRFYGSSAYPVGVVSTEYLERSLRDIVDELWRTVSPRIKIGLSNLPEREKLFSQVK